MFDALIITASFALDIATLKPVGGVAGEGAIAFIMIFLLWRILRVINGMYICLNMSSLIILCTQKLGLCSLVNWNDTGCHRCLSAQVLPGRGQHGQYLLEPATAVGCMPPRHSLPIIKRCSSARQPCTKCVSIFCANAGCFLEKQSWPNYTI